MGGRDVAEVLGGDLRLPLGFAHASLTSRAAVLALQGNRLTYGQRQRGGGGW